MGLQSGWTLPGLSPKPCDACKSSPAAVFCRADSAYLCLTCDSKIHCANKLASRHQRVWMCEVCEQAPAAFTCKADAAALCVTCDADIHSANPLAHRHERVPVEPFFDSAESISSNGLNGLVPNGVVSSVRNDDDDCLLIPNLDFSSKLVEALDIKPDDMFFPEMESLFEFDCLNPIQSSSSGLDSVVPVQPDPIISPSPLLKQPSHENCFDIDFCRKKLSSSFTYPAQSLSHSVSSSSLDVEVVADPSSDISYPFIRNVNQNSLESSVTAPAPASQATQLSAVDRELRVMRYREKRKNRKFQKTIRYASRKAYAETRPRIKGRFAKRNESETEVMDRIFNSAPGSYIDAQYGVVPTF